MDGHALQVANQLVGCLIAWGLAIAGTLLILKICEIAIGVRVGKQQEISLGWTFSMHGEGGYIYES